MQLKPPAVLVHSLEQPANFSAHSSISKIIMQSNLMINEVLLTNFSKYWH